jgi:ABC-type multidrug transport system fused ATPase/permease subunit
MRKVPSLDLDARFFRYLWPYTHYLIAAVVMMVVVAALEVVSPWPLKFIVDNVIGGEPFGAVIGDWILTHVGDDPRLQTVFLAR